MRRMIVAWGVASLLSLSMSARPATAGDASSAEAALPEMAAEASPAGAAGGDLGRTVQPARTDLAQADHGTPAGERPLDLEKQKMRSRFRYLMLGYGLIWLSLGAYLIRMNRGVNRVGREIDALKGRLDDLQRLGR